MDYRRFFGRKADEVARDLVGRMLVRNTADSMLGGRILEVGAYEGGDETPSRNGMKYTPGHIFLMSYRGFHLLNIATDKEGYPSCVEIRQISVNDRKITGAGAISKFLNIGRSLDNKLLGEDLDIMGRSVRPESIIELPGKDSNCLGYFSLR